MDKLVHAGEGTGCRVTLRQIDADPLLLLSFPAAENRDHGRVVHVSTVELHEGELYVAGSTERTDLRIGREVALRNAGRVGAATHQSSIGQVPANWPMRWALPTLPYSARSR